MKEKGKDEPLTDENPLLLFDGVCNLCNGAVRFILKRDAAGVFRFAPLQGPSAAMYLRRFGISDDTLRSVVLVEGGKAYQRSAAALRVLRRLGAPWKFLYAFILLPAPLRDFFYDLIAKNRYRIWGRREECLLPTPELKARFLE
jgi:predicted DCC family thiol-disulfide oxidoreductase YuxK